MYDTDTRTKEYGALNDSTEGDDAEKGFSTEIRFEISPQGYGGTDGSNARPSGKAGKVAAGIARTALKIGLEILIAKRTADNGDKR